MRLLVLLLAFALAACDSGADLLPADGDLFVGLTTVSGTATPALLIRTVEEFGCGGYRVVTDADVNEDEARVEIEGIEAPSGACPTVIAPAGALIELRPATPGGYRIEIKRDTQTDVYEVVPSDEGPTLSTVQASFTSLLPDSF